MKGLKEFFKQKPKVILVVGKRIKGRGRKEKEILFVEEIFKLEELLGYLGIEEEEKIKITEWDKNKIIFENGKFKYKIVDLGKLKKEKVLELVFKFIDKKSGAKLRRREKEKLFISILDEVGYETDLNKISKKELLWGFVDLSHYFDFKTKGRN